MAVAVQDRLIRVELDGRMGVRTFHGVARRPYATARTDLKVSMGTADALCRTCRH